MSRTEDIDNGIWSDPDFEALSPHATLLFLWSWTNPRCGMAGIYKVSHRTISNECKVPVEHVREALEELGAAGMVFYESNVLWVRARVKRLRSRSPQMAKAVAKDIENVSDEHPLRGRWIETYGNDPWLKSALRERSLVGIDDLSETTVGKGNVHRSSQPSREGAGSWAGAREGEEGSTTQREGSPLPDDFPDELRPHLRVVYRKLTDLARRRHAKAVTPMALANVVMARRHKPLVRAAHDCVAHWDGKASGPKDVVAAYRNWLDRTDDMAGVEPLDEQDSPAGHVVQLTEKQARQKRRLAAMRRLTNGDAA